MLYTRHDMLGRESLKGESDIPVDASAYLGTCSIHYAPVVRLGQTVDIGVTPVLRGKYDDFFWSTYIMDGIRRGAMQHAVKQPTSHSRGRSDGQDPTTVRSDMAACLSSSALSDYET